MLNPNSIGSNRPQLVDQRLMGSAKRIEQKIITRPSAPFPENNVFGLGNLLTTPFPSISQTASSTYTTVKQFPRETYRYFRKNKSLLLNIFGIISIFVIVYLLYMLYIYVKQERMYLLFNSIVNEYQKSPSAYNE